MYYLVSINFSACIFLKINMKTQIYHIDFDLILSTI